MVRSNSNWLVKLFLLILQEDTLNWRYVSEPCFQVRLWGRCSNVNGFALVIYLWLKLFSRYFKQHVRIRLVLRNQLLISKYLPFCTNFSFYHVYHAMISKNNFLGFYCHFSRAIFPSLTNVLLSGFYLLYCLLSN